MYPDTNIDAEANDYVDYLPTMPDNCNNDTAMTNELIIGIIFVILMVGTVLYGIYEKNFKVKNDAVTKTNLKKSQSNKESHA
jgi:p-aminobenzoyl-glutamate transporter AbgT